MAKKYTSDLFVKNGGTESEFLMADGSVSSGGGGGGGGSLLVQALDTITLPANEWRVATADDNWLSGSLNYASGGGAEPSFFFRQTFVVKDKESLNDFYLFGLMPILVGNTKYM